MVEKSGLDPEKCQFESDQSHLRYEVASHTLFLILMRLGDLMRECVTCGRDLTSLVSRHKKCWACRKGNKPKRSNIKYTRELLEEAVKHSNSVAGVMRYLGLSELGGNHSHVSRRLKTYEIDTSHFRGQAHNKGKISPRKKSWQQILYLGKPTDSRVRTPQLKRAVLEYGFIEKCSECQIGTTWNSKPIVLHIDHINGLWYDNRIENLRFLCPNCHSQTDTYCRPKRD